MANIAIPNQVVKTFTGRPMKIQKQTVDLEPIFKPIGCPGADCDEKFITVSSWREHLLDTHKDVAPGLTVSTEAEMEDRTAPRLILDIIVALNRGTIDGSPNPLRAIQKTNDSFHATELWRRAWNAKEAPEIHVKKEQYDWLHQLLDRKLPLAADPKEARERRDNGEEQMTVAIYLFALSEDSVRQALTTLPDRRQASTSESEERTASES